MVLSGTMDYAPRVGARRRSPRPGTNDGSRAGPNVGGDVDEMTDLYVQIWRLLPATITIVVEEGRLSSIETHAELSSTFACTRPTTDTFDLSAADMDVLAERTDGWEWTVDQLITYEPMPDLVVEEPPAATEDRTEQWRDFLIESGIIHR
ncbi:MAG: hypothetical protein R2695_01395 [Acidimicrobiales bacterium]